LVLLVGTLLLSSCGSSSNHNPLLLGPQLSGNWQFTVAPPGDQSFTGGLQGGFLVQDNNSLTGSIAFSVASSTPTTVCNSGSAAVTGTISGQNVSLTAVAGPQTFTFNGTISLDNSTLAGTYSSTAGTASDGSPCGTVQSGLTWSAVFVPPLTGVIQGDFHSTGGTAGLRNQDFPVSGVINQALNNGSSATVTGNLGFASPLTSINNYACITTAKVTGRISGNTVTLQLMGTDGSSLGQIGGILAGKPVTFDTVRGGSVLHNLAGVGYAVNTPGCLGTSLTNPGDSGNICLGVGTSACAQPITLTPSAVVFPAQTMGSTATQTITLTNNSITTTLTGLALTLTNQPADAASFTVVGDTCETPGSSFGSPFQLLPGLSCTIPVVFNPQASASLSATLSVTSPMSADNDTSFAVPIKGTGTASSELDFASETGSPAQAQSQSFTPGAHPSKQTESNRAFEDR
jgi:hypothetical protein